MFDFSNLQPGEDLVKYELYYLDGEPCLYLKPAGETNQDYFKAMISRIKKAPARLNQVTSGRVKEDRNEDREMFAKYVVKDWSNIRDADQKLVPFNQANCLEFLNALPDHLFDDLRNFAKNLDNFVGVPEATEKN